MLSFSGEDWLTLSSRRPKTAALERMILSMKLNMYVMNKRGMIVRSIFLITRLAKPWSPGPSWMAALRAASSSEVKGRMLMMPE